MKTIVKNWMPYIKADLEVAKILLASRNKSRWTNNLILWHCQQAIEKSLKAIMAAKGKDIFKIHDLARLKEMAAVDIGEDDVKFILVLNNFYLKSRYPDLLNKPMSNPDNATTKKYFDKTVKLHIWLVNYLKKIK